jgi:hypothetical protein
MDKLRELVAATSTWQTLTGSDDATEALATIFFFEASAPLPHMVLTGMNNNSPLAGRGGTNNSFIPSGTIDFMFGVLNPEEGGTSDNAQYVNSLVEDLRIDMLSLAGVGTYLDIQNLDFERPQIADDTVEFEDSDGTIERLYWVVQGRVQWGLQA